MGEPDGGPVAVAPARMRTLSAGEVAWIALIPCAVLGVLAIALLGPPVGHALFAPGSERLWPSGWWETQGTPEPVKQGRYVLAVLAPLLLVAAIAAAARRRPALRPSTTHALVVVANALVVGLVAVALLRQDAVILPGVRAPALFGVGDAIAAGALLLAALVALRHAPLAARVAQLARETRARRIAALAAAIAFVAIWMLKAVITDGLIGDYGGLNLPWTLNDAMAVVNGRTPLVDYHVIYAKLLPYATAGVLATFGSSTLTYTAFMATLSGLTLLGAYAVFRLLTRSSLLALGLFLPFVAVSDLGNIPIVAGDVSPFTLSAMWPMRYGGVYLLAWLVARHVSARAPRHAWVLFFVASLVAINTLEFGVGAIAATFAALVCARSPRSRSAWLRLAGEAAGGALAAVLLVALGTLVRSGELPRLELLLEWPRIFGTLGLFSLPLPTLGLHLALYATFVGAIVVAAVRWSQRDDDVLLTSMLAWSGVFGLLASSYFVGRPDVLKLAAMMSAWGFALAPLAVVCVRSLAAREWRRPSASELLVLFGLALAVVTLVRLPLPWDQVSRLTAARPAPRYEPDATRFVGERTVRGQKVAILVPMGFRIADNLGLRNVAPFGFMNAVVTHAQMRELVDAVTREQVHAIFTPIPGSRLLDEGDVAPQQLRELAAAGYSVVASDAGLVELNRP